MVEVEKAAHYCVADSQAYECCIAAKCFCSRARSRLHLLMAILTLNAIKEKTEHLWLHMYFCIFALRAAVGKHMSSMHCACPYVHTSSEKMPEHTGAAHENAFPIWQY